LNFALATEAAKDLIPFRRSNLEFEQALARGWLILTLGQNWEGHFCSDRRDDGTASRLPGAHSRVV